MKNNDNAAGRENKKALPKFIVIVLCSLILGGVLGVLMVKLSLENFQEALDAAGLFFTNHIAPWLIIALPVAEFAIPVFTTAACTKEDLSTTSMSHITGAAFTTLVVKVPAATQGAVLYTSAMSLRL